MRPAPILVATDFSESSDVAVTTALDLAHKNGVELHLAHVAPAHHQAGQEADFQAEIERAMQRQLGAGRERLDERMEREREWEDAVRFHVLEGHAPTALAQLGRALRARPLVVGTHGRTGFARLLLGSVAERLLRVSENSVLVARADGEPAGGFSRILVGTDFSRRSFRALEQALDLAAPGASVELLHAWQIPLADSGFYGPFADDDAEHRRLEADAEARGRAFLQDADPRGVDVSFRTVEDAPNRAIQQRLESGSYDLVAVGSHGDVDELPKWLVGSVAEATMRYSPCSVLVAR